VVRAAAAQADTTPAGWERLSLVDLAATLGVRTPSLYRHVDGLPALRREVALLGMGELGNRLADAAIGRSGDDAIVACADAYRRYAHEHPGLYAAAIRAPAADDREMQSAAARAVGIIERVLEGYRLAGDDALHAVRALRALVHGFVSIEAAGGFGLALDLDESYHRLVAMFIAGLEDAAGENTV
jgi:AcrR family transcriptional regulator